jgi:dipeptidase E
MSSIVAIGDEEIANGETRAIDDQIVASSDASTPTALFIPIASGDADGYCDAFREYYGKVLGCDIEILRLMDTDPSMAEIESQVGDADLIYVGGGDTRFMLDVWRTSGIVDLLRQAWEQGTLLTGLSAGALCWAAGGLGDAIALDEIDHGPVSGLGFLDWLHLIVHATPDRRADFGEYLVRRDVSGIALENNAAVEVRDSEWRILTSSPNAFAYQLIPEDGSYTVELLPRDGTFRSLSQLR